MTIATIDTFGLVDISEQPAHHLASREALFRTAAAYLDEHADQPITTLYASAAIQVTEAELRRLFAAFHPDGHTPAQHLRQARLAAAHAELIESDPTFVDLTNLAAHYGFSLSGAFVTAYLRRFGRLPRDPT